MTTVAAEPNDGARRRNAKTKIGAEGAIAPVRARRSIGWIFGGAALVVVGCLAGVFVFTSASHTEKVWVVTKPVARGMTITPQDLGTLSIGEGQSTAALPFTETTSPAGKIAAVDLPKGSLLTSQSVAASLGVPAGKALVGLALKQSQLPAQPLNAGDQIKIVQIATSTGSSTNNASQSLTISGTVADTVQPAAGSNTTTTVVDVLVNETVASNLTSLAAANQVAVYLVSSEG